MVGRGTLSKQRFEYLKERLPSGWKTDAQNRAILGEWEKILSESNEAERSRSSDKEGKPSFNPQNPQHKAKALKLHKALKDKEKVRKQLAREFSFDVS